MAYGMEGHFGLSAQGSFGGAMTSSFDFMPIISETLVDAVEELVEESIMGRYDESPSHEGLLTVQGDVVFEPHPIMLGHILRGVFGGTVNSAAAGDAIEHGFVPTQTDYLAGSCALPPFTLEVYRGVGNAWRLQDAVFNTLAIDIQAGGIVRATAGIIARVSSLTAKNTPSFVENDPWTWDAASLSIAGAANANLENATLVIDNKLEGVNLCDANKYVSRILRNDRRTVMFSGNMNLEDLTEYGIFRAQTQQAFILTLTGTTDASSGFPEMLKLDMPQLRYRTYSAPMQGVGRISAAFEGNCKYDTTSSYSLRATLTNSRTSY